MGCLRGHLALTTWLLLLLGLEAGVSLAVTAEPVERHVPNHLALPRHLLQAASPTSGLVTLPPDVPTASPTEPLTPEPTPTPIITVAPTLPPTQPATLAPPLPPLATTLPPVTTAAPVTPPATVAPTDAPVTVAPTPLPLTPPAPATLAPLTAAPTTLAPTVAPTLVPAPTPAPLTIAPTLVPAPVQATSPPPGKITPSPVRTLASAPPLLTTLAPMPAATFAPPGNSPALITVNTSSPTTSLVGPNVSLAAALAPAPTVSVNTSGASPACLPGTPSCDPLVVKLLLSNTDYETLSRYLFSGLASQLGLQTNQFQISAISAGASRQFNVTFYILPVSGFNISQPVAQNVSSSLSTHAVQLDEALFGNYTFFYAVPNSALEIAPVVAPVAPAPAPTAVPALAPSQGNGSAAPPGDSGGGSSGSTIIIIAAAVGGAAVLGLCALVLCCCLCRKRKGEEQEDQFSEFSKNTSVNTASQLLSRPPDKSSRTLSSVASFPSDSLPRPSSARVFTYEELADATNGWDPMYLLGEGGFGKVYKGVLKDGIKVAVKRLTVGGHQGDREFQVEVEMLSRLHHRHLVKLIGYYYRPDQQLLCYELVQNGSLENHLHGQKGRRPPGAMWQTLQLDWDARMKIAIGAARGLAYLHEDCQPTVIHRDMKASNILLEENFHAKVADFGLAKIAPDNRSDYLTTRVMGTFGYVAPEYAMTGHIMVKSDVYSYGVVLLELLTGRKPVDMSQPQGQENLVTWSRPLLSDPERVEQVVDPQLGDAYPYDDLLKVATIAMACVHPEPGRRPHMGEVVQKLRMLQRSPSGPGESLPSDNDSVTSRDMEALASTLSGPMPAYTQSQYTQSQYTQSQPHPAGGYMSTIYPVFPMHRSMEMPPHGRSAFPSENLSRFSEESGRSQQMVDHDQLARTTVFSEGLEEGR